MTARARPVTVQIFPHLPHQFLNFHQLLGDAKKVPARCVALAGLPASWWRSADAPDAPALQGVHLVSQWLKEHLQPSQPPAAEPL